MIRMFHVGRKVPKGWTELPGAMHLGRGIWMIPCVKDSEPQSSIPDHPAKPLADEAGTSSSPSVTSR